MSLIDEYGLIFPIPHRAHAITCLGIKVASGGIEKFGSLALSDHISGGNQAKLSSSFS